MITPDTIKLYLMGTRATFARKALQTSLVVGMNEHSTIRNFIMISLALQNAQRPGPIINLSLDEFEQAKTIVINGLHMAKVSIPNNDVIFTYTCTINSRL